jgi:hypothetical protein
MGFGLLIGAGIDQQPHAVRVTTRSGPHQRRLSALSVGFAAAHTAPTPLNMQDAQILMKLIMQANCNQKSQNSLGAYRNKTQTAHMIFAFNIGTLGQQSKNMIRSAFVRGFRQLVSLNRWICKHKRLTLQ